MHYLKICLVYVHVFGIHVYCKEYLEQKVGNANDN